MREHRHEPAGDVAEVLPRELVGSPPDAVEALRDPAKQHHPQNRSDERGCQQERHESSDAGCDEPVAEALCELVARCSSVNRPRQREDGEADVVDRVFVDTLVEPFRGLVGEDDDDGEHDHEELADQPAKPPESFSEHKSSLL